MSQLQPTILASARVNGPVIAAAVATALGIAIPYSLINPGLAPSRGVVQVVRLSAGIYIVQLENPIDLNHVRYAAIGVGVVGVTPAVPVVITMEDYPQTQLAPAGVTPIAPPSPLTSDLFKRIVCYPMGTSGSGIPSPVDAIFDFTVDQLSDAGSGGGLGATYY